MYMNEKEKEFIEIIDRVDKNLKRSSRNELKKLICAAPLLLLLLTPFVPGALGVALVLLSTAASVTLATTYARKIDKRTKKVDKELNKDFKKMEGFFSKDRFKNGRTQSRITSANKKFSLPNELYSCIDIEFFEEYINNVFSFLIEDGKVEGEATHPEAVNQFLEPLYNVLGNNVKIIPTSESNADLVIEMQGIHNKNKSALYVYDGNSFYLYVPNKEAVVLFPISKEDMYVIFKSNPNNYDKEVLIQFFSEIYGPLDNDNEFGRYK